MRVVFENNPENLAYYDSGFKRKVEWDLPLTDGYNNEYLINTNLEEEINDADILWLHGCGSRTLRRALRIAKRLRIPVLMRAENCDIAMPDGYGLRGWLKRYYINRILSYCSAFLAIGSNNQKYYLNRGVSSNQIFKTPYAIDNEKFISGAKTVEPMRKKFKSQLGIGAEQKVILFVGKFIPRKCPHLLIKAYNRIDWGGNTRPALLFVGDGEMKGKLRDLAPDAIFLGFKNQSELPAIYSIADVMVLPSRREPWGLVVNEAMACGTAVIVSDQVGCATDLINDTCGRVFPSGDVGMLSSSIIHCLENSDSMGKVSKEIIINWGFSEDITGLKGAIRYMGSIDAGKT